MIRGRGERGRKRLGWTVRRALVCLVAGAFAFILVRSWRAGMHVSSQETLRGHMAYWLAVGPVAPFDRNPGAPRPGTQDSRESATPSTVDGRMRGAAHGGAPVADAEFEAEPHPARPTARRGWIDRAGAEWARAADADPSTRPGRREIERQLDTMNLSAATLHTRALLHLDRAWQQSEQGALSLVAAESDLLDALESEPDRAGAWNDLAVVYLTWAEQHDRPRLLLDAYAATHAARELEPALSEARFNQSLALERLGLFRDAAASLDSSWPAWVDAAELARHRLELLEIEPSQERTRFRQSLEAGAAGGDSQAFLAAAAHYPQEARRWVEEDLLPAWAVEEDAAGEMRLLSIARALSEELAGASRSGDPLLRETVAALDLALARDDGSSVGLLRAGHRAFGEGIRLFPESLAEARARFLEAERALHAGGSPFAAWAGFYLGACDHVQNDLAAAMARFAALDSAAARSPSLAQRLHWARGLMLNRLDLSRAALEELSRSRELAAGLGDRLGESAIAYQQAEAKDALDQLDDAWRDLSLALAGRRGVLLERFDVNILFTAADQTRARPDQYEAERLAPIARGLADLQLRFQQEALRVAARSASPTFLAENHSRLAVALAQAGDDTGGAEQRQLATVAAMRIDDAMLRQRQVAKLRLDDAASPASSVSDDELASAAETFREQRLPYAFIETALLLVERARQHGYDGMRKRWLDAAWQQIEAAGAELEPVTDRHGYLEARRSVLRGRLELEHEGGAGEALRLFLQEQALRSLTPTASGLTRDPSAAAGDPAPLPAGMVFAAFLELPGDALAVLVHAGESVTIHRLEISAPALRQELEHLRAGLEDTSLPDGGSATEGPRARLGRLLLEPWRWRLPAAGRLGLALDDVFLGVPFEALAAATSEGPLLERFEILRVSNPTVLAHGAGGLANLEEYGLVVAASEPDPSWALEPLPGVESEAEAIRAALDLPAHGVLLAGSATLGRTRAALAGARWLHFAGHALVDPADADSSLLVLAREPGAASVLRLQDLATAPTRLDLVVLAGCETARGGTGNLAHALHRAGVPLVIGTLWPVGDEPTARFFTDFYQRLAAGVPPAQALHQTRLAAAHSEDPTLRSLATWGAFVGWGW